MVSELGPDPVADGRFVVIEDVKEELACGWFAVGKQRIILFKGNPSRATSGRCPLIEPSPRCIARRPHR